MLFQEYMLRVSTFRPIEADETIIRILGHFVHGENEHLSASKLTKEYSETGKGLDRKNMREWIVKLNKYGLLCRRDEKLKHGAIPYKISLFGLITYYSYFHSLSKDFLISPITNTDFKFNDVVRLLLLELFEEDTIGSIYNIWSFPIPEIIGYLQDCCITTVEIMSLAWKEIDMNGGALLKIDSKIVREYMEFLFEIKHPTDSIVTKNIREYRQKMIDRVQKTKEAGKPPKLVEYVEEMLIGTKIPEGLFKVIESRKLDRKEFLRSSGKIEDPVFEGYTVPHYISIIYKSLIDLKDDLDKRTNCLIFTIMYKFGIFLSIKSNPKTKEEFRYIFSDAEEDYSENNSLVKYPNKFVLIMYKDKKFYEYTKRLKSNFDIGFRQFNWEFYTTSNS